MWRAVALLNIALFPSQRQSRRQLARWELRCYKPFSSCKDLGLSGRQEPPLQSLSVSTLWEQV